MKQPRPTFGTPGKHKTTSSRPKRAAPLAGHSTMPAVDEVALLAAVRKLRETLPDDATTVAVHNQLQQQDAFKGVSIAWVKKTERTLKKVLEEELM